MRACEFFALILLAALVIRGIIGFMSDWGLA